MNISFNTQSPYSSFYQKGTLMGQNSQQKTAGSNSPFAPGKDASANPRAKFANEVTEDKASISQQMRQMIRDLKQEQYASKTSKDKVNGFSELSGSPDAAEEEEIDTSEKYNYKTVASKIQRAKTSISAGQAVLAAKRETLKIKRKISSGNGDPEELQLALTHAKRMEMVEKLEAMTAEERYDFWQNEFSRCIRCNACRNVCPACTCEKCVFDNNALYTSQKVAETSFEESLFHIIRAWHVAGRCTDCGECSRVCPQGIPLHLLNRKFIKDINEIYGDYQAGSDLETRPPMLTFKEEDPETSIISDRVEGGNE